MPGERGQDSPEQGPKPPPTNREFLLHVAGNAEVNGLTSYAELKRQAEAGEEHLAFPAGYETDRTLEKVFVALEALRWLAVDIPRDPTADHYATAGLLGASPEGRSAEEATADRRAIQLFLALVGITEARHEAVAHLHSYATYEVKVPGPWGTVITEQGYSLASRYDRMATTLTGEVWF